MKCTKFGFDFHKEIFWLFKTYYISFQTTTFF
jgi:hypothetical protein